MGKTIKFKSVIAVILVIACTYAFVIWGIGVSKADYGLHHSGLIESEFAHTPFHKLPAM